MIKPLVTVVSILLGSAALGFVAYVQAHSEPPKPRTSLRTEIPAEARGSLSETSKAILAALDPEARVHIVLVNPVFIMTGVPQKPEQSKPSDAPPAPSGSAVPDVKNWVPAIIVQ